MASLRKRSGSRMWVACFTLPNGRRMQRSTGIIDDGKKRSFDEATQIANRFEDESRRQRTIRQVQRVLQDIHEQVGGVALPTASTREVINQWLASKKGEVNEQTEQFYRFKLGAFLNHLGERVDEDISRISKDDIIAFRNTEAERVRPSTVNHALKVVRMLFLHAKAQSLIHDNPAEDVNILKVGDRPQRRPFTVEQIQKLLAVADEEWARLIYFGLYTGQRLGDLVQYEWERNLDLDAKELRFTTRKTGRHQKIPVAAPLKKFLDKTVSMGSRTGFVHPEKQRSYQHTGGASNLSREFRQLMVEAGLVTRKTYRRRRATPSQDGKTSDQNPTSRREMSQLSFHSLRHTTTSLLKNAGVASSVAEEFVGHDSAEMNRIYTHISQNAMSEAAGLLPDISIPEA